MVLGVSVSSNSQGLQHLSFHQSAIDEIQLWDKLAGFTE